MLTKRINRKIFNLKHICCSANISIILFCKSSIGFWPIINCFYLSEPFDVEQLTVTNDILGFNVSWSNSKNNFDNLYYGITVNETKRRETRNKSEAISVSRACVVYEVKVSAYFKTEEENVSSAGVSEFGRAKLPEDLQHIFVEAIPNNENIEVNYKWNESYKACIVERNISYSYNECLSSNAKHYTKKLVNDSSVILKNIPPYRNVNISISFYLENDTIVKGYAENTTNSARKLESSEMCI